MHPCYSTKRIRFLPETEIDDVTCINSYTATQADYHKYSAYELLYKASIPTPETAVALDRPLKHTVSKGFKQHHKAGGGD